MPQSDFPAQVLAELAQLERDPGFDQPELVDRTDLAFCTIDEPWSKDLDQALCIEPEGEGFVVWYAIADAAWFVPRDSDLFVEGLRRGATIYRPGATRVMLPRALCEGLISLNPQVNRRALLFALHLDARGVCTHSELLRARVHSRAKLDYDGVQRWLDGADPGYVSEPGVAISLRLLRRVGELLLELAERRHIAHYRRTELSVQVGPGLHFIARSAPRSMVSRYNEQISLLCNAEGARFLQRGQDDGVQPIFRVHQAPSRDRMLAFSRHVDALIAAHDLDPTRWRWHPDGSMPLSSYLDALPREGAAGRVARAVHRQAILTNQRSVFAATPAAHYGVGVPLYGRFSAPMREIVGVYLHNEVYDKLDQRSGRLPPGFDDAEALRQAVIEAANAAKLKQRDADRKTNAVVLDQLFEQADGRTFVGTVMGLDRGKVHVLLDEPPIDVKVYLRHLPGSPEISEDHTLVLDEDGVRFRLGDAVGVRVLGRDTKLKRWRLWAGRPQSAS